MVSGLAGDEVTFADGDDLLATGVLTSLRMLQMTRELESLFGIMLEPEDAYSGRLNSVTSLAALVLERRKRAR